MAKETKKEELWNVSQMVAKASEMYPSNTRPNKEAAYKAIQRELERLNLRPTGAECSLKSGVAVTLAEYIISDVMRSYFEGNGTNHPKTLQNNRIKRAERKRLDLLKKLEEESKVFDKDETEKARDKTAYFTPTLHEDVEDDPGSSYIRAQSPEQEAELRSLGFKILSNKAAIPQDFLRYSLPSTSLDNMTEEHVQEIVDRMMLRELFKLFFDFDEEQFRTDLFERAARIDADSGETIYEEGYYALTQKLENPSSNYIRPKPPQKARKPRKTSKDNQRAGNKGANE